MFKLSANFVTSLINTLLYVLVSVGFFLMLRLIIPYFEFDSAEGFLAFKQDYIHIPIWHYSFYIHVFSSTICLIAGLTQFSKTILKNSPKSHKILGRIYAYNILVINFPVGMIMAFYANGLWPTKTAFILLDALWFWFTLKAVLDIKKGNVLSHKKNMIRSFALTFSAVTFRSWNVLLSNTTSIDPLTLYMINGWLGWLPNLIVVEVYNFRISKRLFRSSINN